VSARRRGGKATDRGAPDGGGTDRVVGGLHPVRELLRAGAPLRTILIAEGRDTSPVLDEIRSLAGQAGIHVEGRPRADLDSRAEGLVHQGVLALAPAFPYARLDEVLARAVDGPLLLVALDGVTDPHNLGSIARTAEAVGAHGLLLPSRRSAGVTPAVEKAAAGALAHLKVVRMANLARDLRNLKEQGVWVVGLDGEADEEIGDSRLLTEPLVVVVGAEGGGLARLTREICDQLVRLPMRGRVGSLNASVAAGVALYEVLGRRAEQPSRTD
jgi:23S rRNA (guanosine2251-2'-O)-methyltransferase